MEYITVPPKWRNLFLVCCRIKDAVGWSVRVSQREPSVKQMKSSDRSSVSRPLSFSRGRPISVR